MIIIVIILFLIILLQNCVSSFFLFIDLVLLSSMERTRLGAGVKNVLSLDTSEEYSSDDLLRITRFVVSHQILFWMVITSISFYLYIVIIFTPYNLHHLHLSQFSFSYCDFFARSCAVSVDDTGVHRRRDMMWSRSSSSIATWLLVRTYACM